MLSRGKNSFGVDLTHGLLSTTKTLLRAFASLCIRFFLQRTAGFCLKLLLLSYIDRQKKRPCGHLTFAGQPYLIMALAAYSTLMLVQACFLLFLVNTVVAIPIIRFTSILPRSNITDALGRSGITVNDADGSFVIFNTQTMQLIPQGAASDGSGVAFDASAALWIAVSFLVGIPLSAAGIRGWRFTLGAAIGLSTAVAGNDIHFAYDGTRHLYSGFQLGQRL